MSQLLLLNTTPFLQTFRIVGHYLQFSCPRKCNSYNHQPCHLSLIKSNTCQDSKTSSWETRYFSDPLRVTTFNVCTPYNEEQPLVSLLHFKCAPPALVSSLVVFSFNATFRHQPNQCWILQNYFTSSFFSDLKTSISPYFKFGKNPVHTCSKFIGVYELKSIIFKTAK